jgi:hypothetical protein
MMDDVFSKYLILYRRNSCKSMCVDLEYLRLRSLPQQSPSLHAEISVFGILNIYKRQQADAIKLAIHADMLGTDPKREYIPFHTRSSKLHE